MVLDQESVHSALVGRSLLKSIRVITSIYHLTMKFLTPNGVGCVKGSQNDSRECYYRDKGIPEERAWNTAKSQGSYW